MNILITLSLCIIATLVLWVVIKAYQAAHPRIIDPVFGLQSGTWYWARRLDTTAMGAEERVFVCGTLTCLHYDSDGYLRIGDVRDFVFHEEIA